MVKEHYEEGISHIAKEFVKAIIEQVQALVDNPDIGRIVPEFAEQ